MTIARRDIVPCGVERAYHCTARCVRQSFLCGLDALTGRDYEHRKEWVRERMKYLSGLFALEILGYAVMSTHIHVVPRLLPEQAVAWTDSDVARRWLALYPPRAGRGETPEEAYVRKLGSILADPARVALLRGRLSNLSWFMRCLDEHIARRANKEDRCKGRFWEGRFKCQGLLDEGAILACLIYVDLNPIRAGMAETPEGSDYTSAQDRIMARQAEAKLARVAYATSAGGAMDDAMAKYGGAVAETYEKAAVASQARAELEAGAWLCPFSASPAQAAVFQTLTIEEYLALLDVTGRTVRSGKRGAISRELAPILIRLDVETERWVETVQEYDRLFRRMVGRATEVAAAAADAGRRWFQGVRACRAVFRSGGS